MMGFAPKEKFGNNICLQKWGMRGVALNNGCFDMIHSQKVFFISFEFGLIYLKRSKLKKLIGRLKKKFVISH